jgi:hypothetical protein
VRSDVLSWAMSKRSARAPGLRSSSKAATSRDCFGPDSMVGDPARHECFRSRAGSNRAAAMPRARTSHQKTRTIGFSRMCDRRPARHRVGDRRCCSQWGCNSGPQRKAGMRSNSRRRAPPITALGC